MEEKQQNISRKFLAEIVQSMENTPSRAVLFLHFGRAGISTRFLANFIGFYVGLLPLSLSLWLDCIDQLLHTHPL